MLRFRKRKQRTKRALITKERAKQAVNEMISEGWRCSVESYAEIMEALEKVQT